MTRTQINKKLRICKSIISNLPKKLEGCNGDSVRLNELVDNYKLTTKGHCVVENVMEMWDRETQCYMQLHIIHGSEPWVMVNFGTSRFDDSDILRPWHLTFYATKDGLFERDTCREDMDQATDIEHILSVLEQLYIWATEQAAPTHKLYINLNKAVRNVSRYGKARHYTTRNGTFITVATKNEMDIQVIVEEIKKAGFSIRDSGSENWVEYFRYDFKIAA